MRARYAIAVGLPLAVALVACEVYPFVEARLVHVVARNDTLRDATVSVDGSSEGPMTSPSCTERIMTFDVQPEWSLRVDSREVYASTDLPEPRRQAQVRVAIDDGDVTAELEDAVGHASWASEVDQSGNLVRCPAPDPAPAIAAAERFVSDYLDESGAGASPTGEIEILIRGYTVVAVTADPTVATQDEETAPLCEALRDFLESDENPDPELRRAEVEVRGGEGETNVLFCTGPAP